MSGMLIQFKKKFRLLYEDNSWEINVIELPSYPSKDDILDAISKQQYATGDKWKIDRPQGWNGAVFYVLDDHNEIRYTLRECE